MLLCSSSRQRRVFEEAVEVAGEVALECHEGGPPPATHSVLSGRSVAKEALGVLYVGLDFSRKRLQWSAFDESGVEVARGVVVPERDGLSDLAERASRDGAPVLAAIESMTGSRFVHDRLELRGWDVRIADAQRVKGLAPLACKRDRIDARVLAELAWRDLIAEVWLPDAAVRAERERARFRLHLVKHRTHGVACPVSDLFGVGGRRLLRELELPEPWRGNVDASLALIDQLSAQIDSCEAELRRLGATHPYLRQLVTVPGIAWILAYTIGSEIADISRFRRPAKLVADTGLCPRVYQSGERDRRGTTGQARAPLPALGADRSSPARRPHSRLPRALPVDEEAARQATRQQGRRDRGRAQTR